MRRISRRTAIKSALLAGAAAVGATSATATSSERPEAPKDAVGLLYDATLCIGCKACVVACQEASHLATDTGASGGRYQAPDDLNAQTRNIIKLTPVVAGEQSYVKRQCMHCIDPACVTACMMGALKKREHGIVTWQGEKCVGCRYCQVACPFGVPKFEWTTAGAFYNPRIVKCELCHERIADGLEPACTTVCPRKAVIFGARDALLQEAKQRIADHPRQYVPTVYGEHEGGGTQVLYLSHLPFERLGLPALGDAPIPEMVRSVQGAIYKGFVAPIALYGVLAAVISRNHKPHAPEDGDDR